MPERYKGASRLLWQYFISYLAVMLTVMALLLVFAYESFYRFHMEIIMGNYQNGIELIRERNENELSGLVIMTSQMASSPNLTPFIFKEEPGKSVRLINQLSVNTGSNSFVHGMYLKFHLDEYIFSQTSFYSLENFASRAALFERITQDEVIQAFSNTRQIVVMPEQQVSGYIFAAPTPPMQMIPVFVPLSYSKNGPRCGTVLYLIDKQTYTDLFKSIVSKDRDVYIIMGGELLVSQQVNGIPRERVLEVAQNAKAGDAKDFVYNGKTYRPIWIAGNTMAFEYLLLVSMDELTLAMMDSLKIIVVVAAIVATLGTLLITHFVQSRIKPIRLLHGMLNNSPPNSNELLEIRNSVQKLIDDNAELNTRMESVEELRKSDFVLKFLTGTLESVDEVLKTAEAIKLNVDKQYFSVSILARPSQSEYELRPDKINHLFDDKVSGVSRMMGFSEKIVLIAFCNDAHLLCEWLEAKFQGMRAVCEGIIMATSASHTDFSQGQRAYLEAETAFESRFLRGNVENIRFEKIASYSQLGYDFQPVERLRTALREGDAQHVSKVLDDISRQMRSMDTTLFMFRCMYNDILNVITTEARANSLIDNEHGLYDLFSLSQCLSIDDLDRMLKIACKKMISTRTDRPQANVSDKMRTAHDIILRRYADPGLSVLEIAQKLDMSDSKLSLAFKAAYQMTPLEFIILNRMKQARKLLVQTQMPIKDIAMECGFYEISGFNRRFKAYTGMTPLQYRLSNQARGEEI